MLLVCRFVVSPDEVETFVRRARRALELLTEANGCRGGSLGRAVDDPGRWVLVLRWTSVDAYRRALSPFGVREHVVPLLAEALPDEPAGYETLAEGAGGRVSVQASLRAAEEEPPR